MSSPLLIAPKWLYEAGSLHGGEILFVEDGQITLRRARRRGERVDLEPFVAMPACIDLQVNGGGGVLFNNDPTPGGLARIVAAHQARGTGWILPTVISCAYETMEKAALTVLDNRTMDGIFGIHLEGPHFEPTRRGAHRAEFLRPLDEQTIALVEKLRGARLPVMLTLAPELARGEDIARLHKTGAILSAGHSAASAECIDSACENGLKAFTHLFNAMPPMTSRCPGIVAAALDSQAWCGLIADGIHVDWMMLRIALRARPRPDRMFVVSDAMPTVGGPDRFELYGETIIARDGALYNSAGSLAGAHYDMVTGLANLVHHVRLPLARALAMTIDIPAELMGSPPPALTPGIPASQMVLLDSQLQLMPPEAVQPAEMAARNGE